MISKSRFCGIAAVLTILTPLFSGVGYSQTAICPGPLKDPHPMGAFNFETNSRLDPTTLDGYKSGIVSCVSNLDTKFPLYVHWLIPGPHGWAPVGQKLESVPRLIKDDPVAPMKGCLQYGNQGDAVYGQFLGIDTDKTRVMDEGKRGCRAAAAHPPGPTTESVLGNLLLRFKNFFPSDVTRPQETMLQMEGTVGIEIRGADSYQSIVRYTMTRYPGSEGNASEIVFRPSFQGPAEVLISAFNRRNDGAVKGVGDGQIVFDVSDIRNPQLVYASYSVLDRSGRPVASIDFPVFVPRQ